MNIIYEIWLHTPPLKYKKVRKSPEYILSTNDPTSHCHCTLSLQLTTFWLSTPLLAHI